MSADPEILSERVVGAPRDAVYRAFSDPERLARWWGPEGFTNRFDEFDLRPGGAWRFTMHAPDGAAYAMVKEFVEVVPAERVVIRHIQEGHDFTLTFALSDEGQRTRVTWRMRFDDPEEAERVRPFVVPANEQNFDRLEAQLADA
jgi:uncharacterized protein YndB with AHSA1/START domain